MTKKKKVIDYRPVFGVLAIALVLSVSAVVWAQTYGSSINYEGNHNDYRTVQAPLGDATFGSRGITSTVTPEIFTDLNELSVRECYRIGDEGLVDAESYTRCLIVQDFTDATITPIVLGNPFDIDDTVYIRELWLESLGKATSTVRLAVTTSTAAFISGDDLTILDEDAGTATLMRTFGNAWGADNGAVATGTNFFLTHYAGTDTNVASSQLPIEWANDVNILVFATSTGDSNSYPITGSDNTFDGELYLLVDIVK